MDRSLLNRWRVILFAVVLISPARAQAPYKAGTPALRGEEMTVSIRIHRDRCSAADSVGLVYRCRTSDLVRDRDDVERQFIDDPAAKIIISGIDDCSDISKCNVRYDRASRSFVLLFPRTGWFTEDFSLSVLVVK